MQTKKVRKGFMFSSASPNVLIPKHWIKLVSPKTPPSTAPDAGPKRIAPTTTGIVMNVMSIAPTFKYPNGVNARISMIAIKIDI